MKLFRKLFIFSFVCVLIAPFSWAAAMTYELKYFAEASVWFGVIPALVVVFGIFTFPLWADE